MKLNWLISNEFHISFIHFFKGLPDSDELDLSLCKLTLIVFYSLCEKQIDCVTS